MPFVPDASQPAAPQADPTSAGSFVPDPGQKPAAKESATDVAKDWGSAIVRPVAKAGIYALTFIPDIATSLENVIANATERGAQKVNRAVTGAKADVQTSPPEEMPSTFFLNKLDQYTRAPTTGIGKFSEEAAAIVASGGSAAGKAGGRLVEDAAKAVGKKLSQKFVGHTPHAGLTLVTSQAAEQAHNAGIMLSPSYVGGRVSKAVQGAVGGAKTDKYLSDLNQPVYDRLAKTSIGLHPDDELNDHNLDLLRKGANTGYDRLAAIGQLPPDPLYDAAVKATGGRFAQRSSGFGGKYRFKSIKDEKSHYLNSNTVTAQEAIDEIRELRKISRSNLKQYGPEKNALGMVQRQLADALDARLDRRASALAKQGVVPPDVYKGYVQAREQLAKIATVDDSLGPGGHVIPHVLSAAQEAGVKMSGGLKIVADTAKHFSRNAQYLEKKGSEGMFSPMDFLIGGTGLVTGHGAATTGMALARPIVRAALGTKVVQGNIVRGMPKTKALAGAATRGLLIRGSEAAQEKDSSTDKPITRAGTSGPSMGERLLNNIIPSADAADAPKKMIGGLPATVDAKGNMKVLGVAASPGQMQDYITRLTASIANNKETVKHLPPDLVKQMQPLFDDMDARLVQAKEIQAQAKKKKAQ